MTIDTAVLEASRPIPEGALAQDRRHEVPTPRDKKSLGHLTVRRSGTLGLSSTIWAFGESLQTSWEPGALVRKDSELDRRVENALDPEAWSLFYRRAPAWRRIGPELRLKYLQLALHNAQSWLPGHVGPVGAALQKSLRYMCQPYPVAWTVNLAPQVEAAARASTQGPAGYLRDRLTAKLALPRLMPFWLAVECTTKERLHVHGAILWARKSLVQLERVLRRFGGPVEQRFKHQLDTQAIPNVDRGLGWAGYAAKQLPATGVILGHRADATTRALTSHATRLHALHRTLVSQGGSR